MSNKIEQRTVTIPLEEYIVMKENSEVLFKALNEREIISLGSTMDSWNRYFITDENTVALAITEEITQREIELNRLRKELRELRDETKRHYAVEEKRYMSLSKTFKEYTSASIWTRIMRVFNKQY